MMVREGGEGNKSIYFFFIPRILDQEAASSYGSVGCGRVSVGWFAHSLHH